MAKAYLTRHFEIANIGVIHVKRVIVTLKDFTLVEGFKNKLANGSI